MGEAIFIGGGGEGYHEPQELLLKYANRHGLIAGATGTGKTVTLQILAEAFSREGVPVFLADVKGDLSGLAKAGSDTAKLHEAFMSRAETIGLDLQYHDNPVVFWDLYGKHGHPIRTTVEEMGPLLLARLLDLSEAQEGVLNVAFRAADDEGLPLLDLKDLRALLLWVAENSDEISVKYGYVDGRSIGAIQRDILVLQNQGGDAIFGEPALELNDMIVTEPDGRGRVNVLAADQLMQAPTLYASFLLWLMSELFEELPEVGNPDKPKMVFFFDEAHLLFDDAPKILIDKVEQVARLIRSKGVGIYFITQNPDDVPDDVLSQLGNRFQHALRAFTARDQTALKKAAETYRANPRFDTAEAIRDVGTGEAVTSMLIEKGAPGIVERTLIRPPASQLGPITDAERAAVINGSPLKGKYDTAIDRHSAEEMLRERTEAAAKAAEEAEKKATEEEVREFNKARRYGGEEEATRSKRSSRSKDKSLTGSLTEAFVKELTGPTGRRVVRGILGGLFRGR